VLADREFRELGTLPATCNRLARRRRFLPPLLALDGEVELTSVRGSRRLPLEKFFLGYRKTALAPDEMITKVLSRRTNRTDWAKNGKRGRDEHLDRSGGRVAITPKKEVRIALGVRSLRRRYASYRRKNS